MVFLNIALLYLRNQIISQMPQKDEYIKDMQNNLSKTTISII